MAPPTVGTPSKKGGRGASGATATKPSKGVKSAVFGGVARASADDDAVAAGDVEAARTTRDAKIKPKKKRGPVD